MQNRPVRAVSTAIDVLDDRTHAARSAWRSNIRRNPFRHVGAATAVGIIAGVAVMALMKRR